MLRFVKIAATAGFFLILLAPASAQCIPSLCAIAITVQSDASGIVLGGSGTSSVTLAFGSMQAFGGTTSSGVTKTVTSSTWTASTPIDVKVTCTIILTLLPCLSGISPSYTLTAQLQTADAVNNWKVGGLPVTGGGTTTLTAIGTFSATTSYQFALTIPFTESPGAITNHINLVATSN